MPYRLLDDAPTADVGFVASGDTLDACFQAAADATLDVMLGNRDALQPRERRTITVASESVDLALLKFLEELIFFKDAEHLFLHVTHVRVDHRGERWRVDAVAEGETIDPARHLLAGDVKAVTLHRLDVRRTDAGWEATVVLDI